MKNKLTIIDPIGDEPGFTPPVEGYDVKSMVFGEGSVSGEAWGFFKGEWVHFVEMEYPDCVLFYTNGVCVKILVKESIE